jgi:endonuclease/exonuclease/phosphatase (EEP) superfamily protein YafD
MPSIGAGVLVRNEIRGAVTSLALVAVLLLVAVSVDFGIPGQALLQSLRFHIAALLLLAVIVLLAAGGWRRAVVFGLVLAISVGEGGYYLLRMQMDRAEGSDTPRRDLLKVLSFNILRTNTANAQAIADLIVKSDADIVVVIEAEPLFPLLGSLGEIFASRVGCDEPDVCDTLLLSRTPLVKIKRHNDLGEHWRDRLITAVTVIDGQRLNVVAAHMIKPYFDFGAVAEASILGRIIGRREGPMVIAGDFNAAPWSDNLVQLISTGGLTTGPFYPPTWPIEAGPLGLPIDNVFARPPLVIEEISAIEDPMGSNHRGLIARISIAAGQ